MPKEKKAFVLKLAVAYRKFQETVQRVKKEKNNIIMAAQTKDDDNKSKEILAKIKAL